MSYGENEFVKIFNNVKAPAGFHYMPDGKLMKDADHIAKFGYIEKILTGVNIQTHDIKYVGETRNFNIYGEPGCVFSIEVFDDASTPNYYNFNTNTFSTTKRGLNKVFLEEYDYEFSVKFPAIGSGSLTKYTINIIAETVNNIRTSHKNLEQAFFADGSINVNGSTGSNTNILRKIIYQDVKKNLYISCIAPSLYATSADTVNGAVSSSNRIVIDGDATDTNIVRVGDLVTGSGIASSIHAIVDAVDPDGDNTNEIQISIADSIGDEEAITFTPPFNGVTPHSTDSTTGRQAIELSSGETASFPFTVTVTAPSGRALSVFKTPTTNELCAFKNITFESAALAISDEDTASSSKFFRWPITNITGLAEGMTLDPARSGTGANTTTPARISKYKTTSTSSQLIENKYSNNIVSTTLTKVEISAIDNYYNDITAIDRVGTPTAQKGNIVFNVQQLDALKSDSNVRIFGHGKNNIQSLTGASINIKNVLVTPTQVSTTTSGAVSNSTTIPLTEVRDVNQNSIIRGIGINAAVSNPTVTNKAAASGGANITASAAQTLESGQTLFFDGASRIVTITGTIDVTMGISDTTIHFDLEKFMTCA